MAKKTSTRKPPAKTPGISDEAVKGKTGRTWSQGLRILDAASTGKMNHKEIVAWIKKNHDAGPW